jgi:hypothetical protein
MKKNYKYLCDYFGRKIFRVEILKQISEEFSGLPIFEVKHDDGKITNQSKADLLTKKAAQKLLMKFLKYDLRDDNAAVKQMKDNLKITKEKIKQLEKEMKVK